MVFRCGGGVGVVPAEQFVFRDGGGVEWFLDGGDGTA